jgi:hypothetical protein
MHVVMTTNDGSWLLNGSWLFSAYYALYLRELADPEAMLHERHFAAVSP